MGLAELIEHRFMISPAVKRTSQESQLDQLIRSKRILISTQLSLIFPAGQSRLERKRGDGIEPSPLPDTNTCLASRRVLDPHAPALVKFCEVLIFI